MTAMIDSSHIKVLALVLGIINSYHHAEAVYCYNCASSSISQGCQTSKEFMSSIPESAYALLSGLKPKLDTIQRVHEANGGFDKAFSQVLVPTEFSASSDAIANCNWTTTCMKVTLSVLDVTLRLCGEGTSLNGRCSTVTDVFNVTPLVCTCSGDFCNSAPLPGLSTLKVLLAAILTIVGAHVHGMD